MSFAQAAMEPFQDLAARLDNVWLGPPPRSQELDPELSPFPDRQATINGVPLPQNVINELRKLGVPLAFYNAGELRDAVNACAVDCTLVDDEDGVTLQDKMTLTTNERAARQGETEQERHRVTKSRTFGVIGMSGSFVDKLGPHPARGGFAERLYLERLHAAANDIEETGQQFP